MTWAPKKWSRVSENSTLRPSGEKRPGHDWPARYVMRRHTAPPPGRLGHGGSDGAGDRTIAVTTAATAAPAIAAVMIAAIGQRRRAGSAVAVGAVPVASGWPGPVRRSDGVSFAT